MRAFHRGCLSACGQVKVPSGDFLCDTCRDPDLQPAAGQGPPAPATLSSMVSEPAAAGGAVGPPTAPGASAQRGTKDPAVEAAYERTATALLREPGPPPPASYKDALSSPQRAHAPTAPTALRSSSAAATAPTQAAARTAAAPPDSDATPCRTARDVEAKIAVLRQLCKSLVVVQHRLRERESGKVQQDLAKHSQLCEHERRLLHRINMVSCAATQGVVDLGETHSDDPSVEMLDAELCVAQDEIPPPRATVLNPPPPTGGGELYAARGEVPLRTTTQHPPPLADAAATGTSSADDSTHGRRRERRSHAPSLPPPRDRHAPTGPSSPRHRRGTHPEPKSRRHRRAERRTRQARRRSPSPSGSSSRSTSRSRSPSTDSSSSSDRSSRTSRSSRSAHSRGQPRHTPDRKQHRRQVRKQLSPVDSHSDSEHAAESGTSLDGEDCGHCERRNQTSCCNSASGSDGTGTDAKQKRRRNKRMGTSNATAAALVYDPSDVDVTGTPVPGAVPAQTRVLNYLAARRRRQLACTRLHCHQACIRAAARLRAVIKMARRVGFHTSWQETLECIRRTLANNQSAANGNFPGLLPEDTVLLAAVHRAAAGSMAAATTGATLALTATASKMRCQNCRVAGRTDLAHSTITCPFTSSADWKLVCKLCAPACHPQRKPFCLKC